MKTIFGRNNHWISVLIQLRTWGDWSHVGIVDGDQVIEAVGPPIGEYVKHCLFNTPLVTPHGVRYTPIEDFKSRYFVTEIRYLPGDIEKARESIGRPFDMRALFGGFFYQNWQDPDKDCCSEVVARAVTFIDDIFAHKFNPSILYWISSPVELWP
jgi:hypothetical protein